MSKKLFDKFYDSTARIGACIPLAGAYGELDSFPESLHEFAENSIDELERCVGPLPGYIKDTFENCDTKGANESFITWMYNQGMFGFLVSVETPNFKYTSKTHSTYSWGFYQARWFYGETFEQAAEKGLAWVKEKREAEKESA